MLDVNIQKRFSSNGRTSFALDVSFSMHQGTTVLFGPSGSGKTTVLRAIAGIVTPDQGTIAVDGRAYFDSAAKINLPIQQRRVGYVFQDYLLFPHLTAAQNVAYGIRSGSDKSRHERTLEILRLFGIGGAAERYPRELSGGEQQRVALARALASDPDILLLDEPLSAVDVATRSRLLDEISEAQRKSGIPFLYVTHTPADAIRAGDEVLILEEGRIVQRGNPLEVFNAPQSAAAARAVGDENILVGKVVEQKPSEGITLVETGDCRLAIYYTTLPLESRVTVGIPSEDIILSRERITQTSARNLLTGTVREIIRDPAKVVLVVACGVDLKVRITRQALEALGIAPGVTVYLLIKASACRVLP